MISIEKAFKLLIKTAAWATPHVQRWHRNRHLNQTEALRNLECKNWGLAEEHFTLAIEERKLSTKQHVELLAGLAQAQLPQGKVKEAKETLESAVEIAVTAKNSAGQIVALSTLVDIQIATDDNAGAEKTAIEIDRLERAQKPPNHKRIAIAARKLGTALRRSNRGPEALKALERAAKFAEQAFGAKHSETASALTELGEMYSAAGNHAEAQRCLRSALEIHRETVGPTSTEATHDICQLAQSLAESGDLDAAVKEYERLVALGEQQIGGNREERAEAQVRLAALYVEAGRMSRAQELLMQAMSTLARKGGPMYVLALEAMAYVEDDRGKPAAANELRERAALLAHPPQPQPPEPLAKSDVPVKTTV